MSARGLALAEIYGNGLGPVAWDFMVFRDAFRDQKQTRAALAHLMAYHQGGLKHLFESAAKAATDDGGSDGKSDHVRSRASRGTTAGARPRNP